MKMIHERVNLVPIITKVDTLSEREIWVLKKRMIRQLRMNGIHFHTFGMDPAEVQQMAEKHQLGAAPFVISTRRDEDGQLHRSELQTLVSMCLYERFRYTQEDAARKAILWRGANDRSDLSTSITAAAITVAPQPFPEGQLTNQHVVQSDMGFIPPPHSDVVDPAAIPATSPPSTGELSGGLSPALLAIPNSTSPDSPAAAGGATGPLSPTLPMTGSVASYIHSTAYTPSSVAFENNTAAEARLALIELSTGMAVDSSNRPNVIMDDAKNTVQALPEGSFMEHYFAPPPGSEGTEFKVEIPFSASTYQPSISQATSDSTLQKAVQRQQLQHQHTSFILPSGYQAPFLVPPSEFYQAAILASAGAGPVVPGEIQLDIWEAIELDDLATVQHHLNNGASPDQRNSSRSTLLHRAAWQGSRPYPMMHLLISYGANVNLTNTNGNTVLQNVLMKHDDPALIKLLLDNGAESSIVNNEGMNTLVVAVLFNKLDSVKFLLENDFASSDPESIMSALQRARSSDKKAMKMLLKSWQGRDGESRRAELMQRLRTTGPYNAQSPSHGSTSQLSHNRSLSQLQNPSQNFIADATSVDSFDTNRDGK
ncbi:hypothetical protein EDD11_007500 [Mortierella claussenii]|nr:hypothetical protein EDD11_007500 [Mortierella claussenii]